MQDVIPETSPVPGLPKQVKAPADEEKLYTASQWQLMWWRFIRHRLAVISTVIVILLYAVAVFCEFLAPYDPNQYFSEFALNPPEAIRFRDSQGNWSLRPFIYARHARA